MFELFENLETFAAFLQFFLYLAIFILLIQCTCYASCPWLNHVVFASDSDFSHIVFNTSGLIQRWSGLLDLRSSCAFRVLHVHRMWRYFTLDLWLDVVVLWHKDSIVASLLVDGLIHMPTFLILLVISLGNCLRHYSSKTGLLVQDRLTLHLLLVWIWGHFCLQSINLFLNLPLFGIQVFLSCICVDMVRWNACEPTHSRYLAIRGLIKVSSNTLWARWTIFPLFNWSWPWQLRYLRQISLYLLLLLLKCHFLFYLVSLIGVLLLILIKLLLRWRLLFPLWRCFSLRTCFHHIVHLLLGQSFWGVLWSFLCAGAPKSCEHFLLQSILLGHYFT